MTLTVEQRRMVVEYFATKCVEEMPSEDMPRADFFRDLHSEEWRLQTMKAIDRVISEEAWKVLSFELESYQSFDRDPEGWMHENDYEGTVRSMREYLNDRASVAIDVVARY